MFNHRKGQQMERHQGTLRRSALACVIGYLGLGGIAVHAPAAYAQVAEAQRSYHIPSGALEDALGSFGRAAGVLLSFSPEHTANLRSAGLRGSYSVQGGLDALLTGSGYRAVRQPDGSYLLAKVAVSTTPPEAVTALPGVTVIAEADRETASGPVNGYVAKRSATGTKTDTALLEVPQSISVIGRTEMEARGALDLMDVVAQTPGVATAAYGPDNRGWEYIALRGFPGNSSSFRDGLPQTQFGVVYRMTEPWGLERVEIMRGPSSVLFGQGDVGGVINRVSKTPGADSQRAIEVQYGSFNRKQVALDVGAAQGDVAYRLLGLSLDSNDQDRYPDGRRIDRTRHYLAPSLRWQVNADTALTLLAEFLKDKSGEDPYYLFYPVAGGGTRLIKYGEPSFSRFSQDQYSLGYQLEHAFGPAWSLRQNARYTDIALKRQSVWGEALDDDGHTLLRSARSWDDGLKQGSIDTMLQGKLRSGDVAHTVLFGLDWNHLAGDAYRFRGDAPSLDLLNPVYGMSVPQPAIPTANFNQKTDQIGLYAQDQIRLGQRWIATLGARRDQVRTTTDNHQTGLRSRQRDDAWTGRVGVSYLLGGGWAPYASYATSFLPVSGADSDNNPFKPSKGKQVEAGIKYQPEDGNTLFTAAVFDLRKTNVLTYDNITGDARQIGKQTSRGLELEAKTALTRQLSATASLTAMQLKVVESADATEVGKVPAAVPERTASLWLDYAVGNGFGFGAGVNYVGPRQNDEANTNTERAFTLLNAALRYDHGPWRLILSASNALNKKYNTICYHGECYQGRERTLVAAARYHW